VKLCWRPVLTRDILLLGNDRYVPLSGTSMATPHVSGVAALVWSHFPTQTAQAIRSALTASALDLGEPGKDEKYGYGLVQADGAFNLLSSTPPCTDSPVGWHDDGSDENDWDGSEFNCVWYGVGIRCTLFGNLGTDGKTANEACCACGGGISASPNVEQTEAPSLVPTETSSEAPSLVPTKTHSGAPSLVPTKTPSESPSLVPTKTPSESPSLVPTKIPSESPSLVPSKTPSESPSLVPTKNPSDAPTCENKPLGQACGGE
jgi:hypothetical protein